MNRDLPAEALAFAEAVRGALGRLGGVDVARRAEADPRVRRDEVEPALRALGLLDLAPLRGETETLAAALALREAGAVVCPWPLMQTLSVTEALDGAWDAIYVGDPRAGRAEHLDLFSLPLQVALDRTARALGPIGPAGIAHAPLDPFGVPCAVSGDADPAPPGAVELSFALEAFYVLGALDTVLGLTARYADERRQFGRSIGNFGATRWRLADMAVARSGLDELAAYTLWRLLAGDVTRADVLALRMIELDAARTVLHHGHQVFAAIGLCDEHDLSVIDRHLQPLLRRPAGLTATTALFAESLEQDGFDALFPIGARAVADDSERAALASGHVPGAALNADGWRSR